MNRDLNEFQIKMINDIKSLPKKNLHYITAQQSNQYSNLTLKELKKLIKRGIRRYIQELEPYYYPNKENELVKFYCVFETTKEFNLNLKNESLDNIPFMGLHFHLFISCPDNYTKSFDGDSLISFQNLIFQIFYELTSIKHKQNCITEYGHFKIEKLEERFLQYHTKQFSINPSLEMILKNQ